VSQISSCGQAVDDARGRIDALQQQLNELKSELNANQERLSDNQTAIDQTTDKLNGQYDFQSSVNNATGEFYDQVNALRGQVASIADYSSTVTFANAHSQMMGGLLSGGRFSQAQGNLEAAGSTLSNAINNTSSDLDDLESQQRTLTNQANDLRGAISDTQARLDSATSEHGARQAQLEQLEAELRQLDQQQGM
jgi:chromosome segregation ATPase